MVKRLLNSWNTKDCFEHISPVAIPSHEKIIEIVQQARRILFPGYFTKTRLHAANLEYYIGKETTDLYEKVTEQITMAIRHDCRRNNLPCTNCEERSQEMTLAFIETLPRGHGHPGHRHPGRPGRRSGHRQPRRGHLQLSRPAGHLDLPPGP